MRRLALSLILPLAMTTSPGRAQTAPETARSAPMALPSPRTVPQARDIAWTGGTMRLDVDASDTTQRIIRVKQTIPIGAAGPLTLLFPQWLPGNHAPRGQIEKLAGLTFEADGTAIDWERDPLDVYAFHLSVPPGTKAVTATFQFLAPTAGNQGRIVLTDRLMNLQWQSVSLYPAGFYTRRLPIQANVTLPDGWTAAGALKGTQSGNVVSYEETDYDTLIDSPLFAGQHARRVELGHAVALNIFADNPDELQASPTQLDLHRKLVDEAVALFGARHFDRYEFLFAISDSLGGIGLEHHRSSENGVGRGYFTKWTEALGNRDLLAHEFVHSWNGKFRRPELLWTPDFATPMQDNLLWLYEGQTQFWGYVLSARAGLLSKAETLDALAAIAARLDNVKGRQWRPLEDTTHDPIIAARRPKAWPSWQRSEEYYNEGLLIWLEADGIIRSQTNGTSGLDDFASTFFGMKDGDWGVLTYGRQDIVTALESIVSHDWDGFLRERVDRTSKEAPKGGFALGGYRLVYGPTPNSSIRTAETKSKYVDQSYGPGLIATADGNVTAVIWDSPAFKAGMAVGNRIIAINGEEFSTDLLRSAIGATAEKRTPLSFIVKQDRQYRTITLDYSGGLRYPRLEKTGEGKTSLDRLLESRTGTAPVS
ncbi:M61 family metallopeptidase [Sphingobium lignivorans]|uniref:Metalloprotease with PDZ domain n=1 Tax=Sphingobium lignivorans TaxID=2735886 RepID=A0ABR6NK96_9SPHN|nr:M61 family metallopeptidase [Sphingobium lignivorans]MBB5987707.1 putative metalloprotease with PDZ domain [Sphingobium lignivorans]